MPTKSESVTFLNRAAGERGERVARVADVVDDEHVGTRRQRLTNAGVRGEVAIGPVEERLCLSDLRNDSGFRDVQDVVLSDAGEALDDHLLETSVRTAVGEDDEDVAHIAQVIWQMMRQEVVQRRCKVGARPMDKVVRRDSIGPRARRTRPAENGPAAPRMARWGQTLAPARS